jgi:ABC-type Mn2+/Zn2+ transport system ATPase subunit
MSRPAPLVAMLAGPNGAGKSTTAAGAVAVARFRSSSTSVRQARRGDRGK